MDRLSILTVEDEPDVRELMVHNLSREGFDVDGTESGEEAIRLARSRVPNAILLDLMLPDIDGLEVCRRLKQDPRTSAIPILMVTARGEESDVVAGLELGADDYITKPFSPKVVVARLKSILRRQGRGFPGPDDVLRFDDLIIHPGRHEVAVGGVAIPLTASEFRLLHTMARRPGWVFTRYQLVDAVHGEKHAVSDRSVDVQIVGLRRKLGDNGGRIETVRGVGYRFRE